MAREHEARGERRKRMAEQHGTPAAQMDCESGCRLRGPEPAAAVGVLAVGRELEELRVQICTAAIGETEKVRRRSSEGHRWPRGRLKPRT